MFLQSTDVETFSKIREIRQNIRMLFWVIHAPQKELTIMKYNKIMMLDIVYIKRFKEDKYVLNIIFMSCINGEYK